MNFPIRKYQHFNVPNEDIRLSDVCFRYYRRLAPRVTLKCDFSNYKSNVKLLYVVTLKAKIPYVKITQ